MKTIIGFLAIAFLALSCNQKSSVKLGKQPLDLEQNALNINIPEFFSEEKNFEDEHENDLFVEVEEKGMEHEKGTLSYFVYYNIDKNEKKLKLAKLGNLEFENLELLTDLKDEKTYMIAVSKDSLTTQKTNELIKTISEKYGKSEKIDQMYKGDYYRWEKENTVVKLSVTTEIRFGFEEYDRVDRAGEGEGEEKEETQDKANQTVKINILTKDFEKTLKNSYSGMAIFSDYF